MNILNPAALLLALLAVPIVLLYLLRLQRREQTVSSTLLWRQALLDREANTLWQKLRSNLLLFLQLATLAFLVFALVRPFVQLPGSLNGRLIVLLDASASMQATDVLPSRFEAAKAEVRGLIETLSGGDEMMLILVDASPRSLSGISTDRLELLSALNDAQPSLSPANWSAAIALGSAAATEGATIVVVSDGAHADDLKLINRPTRYIPIGANGDNLSIGTVTLRRTGQGTAAFIRITNSGTRDDEALVSLRAGDQLVDARTVKVPAGQSAAWTVNDVPADAAGVKVGIDKAQHNTLAVDDVAYAVGSNASLRRALLVTRGNRFLEQALQSLPNLQVSRAISLSMAVDDRPYDVYVLDNIAALPGELPPRANVVIIGSTNLLSSTGVFSNTGYVRTVSHPIAQSVDWRTINVQFAQEFVPPVWLRPVVEAQGGPLLYAGLNPDANSLGQTIARAVVIPFELRRSDLPLQLAFPILMANAVDWLAPAQGLNIPLSVKPGDVVVLPAGAIVQRPSGEKITLDQRGFAQTSQPGIYLVQVGDLKGAFAVNFFNSQESEITPNPSLTVGPSGASPGPGTAAPQHAQREIWRYLAALALVLLLVEWWVYQRGLPRLRRSARVAPSSTPPPGGVRR